MLNFDEIECWGRGLSAALADVLPPDFESLLIAATPKYVEDAREIIFKLGDRTSIIAKVSEWLQLQPFVAYHGSRLTADEIQAVQRDGLRPLVASDRAERLIRILSRNPNWPTVETKLAAALQQYGSGNFGGKREGQVHLTLSRTALIQSFNHYLVEGSEFDGHVAQHLLGPEGRQMLRSYGSPVMFEVHVPAGQAFAACNPYGVWGDEPANPVNSVLAVWGYRIACSNFGSKDYLLDAGLIFRSALPPEWIKRTIHLTETDLLRYYRP